MAVFAAVVSLMHLIEDIQHHPHSPITLDKLQIESLSEKVGFFLDFLEAHSSHKEVEEHLQSEIIDVAYAAEDIIESHIADQILGGGSQSHGHESFNLFCQSLQKVIENMELLKTELAQIQDNVKIQDLDPKHSISTGPSIVPATNDVTMVGFDDVLIEMVDNLTCQQPARQIVPIVGMGGIGKTTLARNVYNYPLIVQHFDIRAWITISQEYRVREILFETLLCVIKGNCNENLEQFIEKMSQAREDELGLHLYQRLSGRRYLIVMDDVWAVEIWDELKIFMPDGGEGGRIVITARQSNLLTDFGSHGFKMNFLDEDQSWNLLCKHVFSTQECCPVELEKTGRRIAENCKGLPLSIVVVGGFLANSNKTLEYWEYVGENIHSVINSEDDEHCLKIVSLSYSHLPIHLKPCFLYMGVFPEDSRIRVSELVNLWVAEGFLKPIQGKTLEVVAKEYLKDLIGRNLIFISEVGSGGQIKSCHIHDLLRQICLREAQKYKFISIWNVSYVGIVEGIHSERRVVIDQSTSKEKSCLAQVLNSFPSTSLTRSLTCHHNLFLPSDSFRLLRVFKTVPKGLPGDETRYSIEHILQLVNSRHLAFRNNYRTDMFPSSIRLLWNLQTLIVKDQLDTRIIAPPEIWEMPQLRHLELGRVYIPDPPGVPTKGEEGNVIWRNLQTILGITDFRFSENSINRIPNIKKLRVWFDDVTEEGWSDNYDLKNLGCLHELESLNCIFPSNMHLCHRVELLKNFVLPISLKKLNIHGSNLLWEDMAVIGSLPYLQVLKLGFWSFHGSIWNPVEGQFLSLKFLQIICDELVYWTANDTHFPSLEYLVLINFWDLEEIPLELGEIPSLRLIVLDNCSRSAVLSAKNILDQQEDLGNVGLQVRVRHRKNAEFSELESMTSDNFLVRAVPW